MKTSICFVVVLAFASYADAYHHEELLQKYGCKKIFESCFGKKLMEEKMKEFKGHCDACKAGSPKVGVVRKAFDWSAVFRQQAGGHGPIYIPFPVQQQSSFRQKRSHHTANTAFFHEEKIRDLKNTFIEKMKLGACVLQRMNILDADMNMQWTALRKLYSEINIDPELKQDLLEVNTKCQQFVTCIPFNEKELGSFPVGLKQAIYYFKCEKKKKVEACMKKDLRQAADMFELQGLDGLLDHIQEDDEKMLKVLKVYSKFGNDDFDIFF